MREICGQGGDGAPQKSIRCYSKSAIRASAKKPMPKAFG